jgi:hypothetical protein
LIRKNGKKKKKMMMWALLEEYDPVRSRVLVKIVVIEKCEDLRLAWLNCCPIGID